MLIDFFPNQNRYCHGRKLLFDLECLKQNIEYAESLKNTKANRLSFKDAQGNIIDVTDPDISVYDYVMGKLNEDKV